MGTTGKELVRILRDHGWTVNRIRGSHHVMVKDGQRSVPVPVHGNRELPKPLVDAIRKQAGLGRE